MRHRLAWFVGVIVLVALAAFLMPILGAGNHLYPFSLALVAFGIAEMLVAVWHYARGARTAFATGHAVLALGALVSAFSMRPTLGYVVLSAVGLMLWLFGLLLLLRAARVDQGIQ